MAHETAPPDSGPPGTGPHVVVVGGGIAGLAAAFFLKEAGSPENAGSPWGAGFPESRGLRVTVLEGSPDIGGKLRTSDVAGVPVDVGAEALLARRPEGIDLITAAGLGQRLVPAGVTSSAIYTRGALRPLPKRQFMGVPADIAELAATGIVSAGGIERAKAETPLPPGDGDTSVTEYIGARLGPEIVDRLVDPLLGGVYAGRSEDLSFRATLAPLAAAAERHPTLTEAAAGLLPPAPVHSDNSNKRPPVFVSLTTGIGSLPEAVAKAANASVRTGAMVRELARTSGGWRLTVGSAANPEYLDADAVVLAVPAVPASRLLSLTNRAASSALAAIPYASMAIITLAFRAGDFPEAHRGRSGYLVPAVDGRAVKAATFSTIKWPHLRAPGGRNRHHTGRAAGEYLPGGRPPVPPGVAERGDGVHIVRCSVGRSGEVAVLQRDDADLVSLAAKELGDAIGLAAEPIDSRVTRWGGGLPQYNVGHLERVAAIREAVAAQPGLAVAGAAYDGVGIPACIATARSAADQILAYLRSRRP